MEPYNNYTERNYGYSYGNNIFPSSQNGSSGSFDFISWILKILKYWYLFVIGFVLAFGLAYLKNKTWTPTYRTASTILIDETNKSSFRNDLTSGSSIGPGLRNINNQMIMYGSYNLISKVVSQMNLTNEVYTRGRFKNYVHYKKAPVAIEASFIAGHSYGLEFEIKGIDNDTYEIIFHGNDAIPAFTIKGKYGESIQHSLFFIDIQKTEFFINPKFDLWFRFLSKEFLVAQYSGGLSYRLLVEGSSVMEISLLGKVAERDVEFLDILNKTFFNDNLERKNQTAEKAIEFLDNQLAIIKDSISSSVSKLDSYQAQTGIYTQDKSGSKSKILDELDQRKSEIQLKKNYVNYLSNYLSQKGNDVLADPSTIISSPQLSALINQYNILIADMKMLGPESPIYKKNAGQLEDIKRSLKEAIAMQNNSIKFEEESVQQRYGKTMAEIANLPQQERRFMNYERDFKINDSYYNYLLQKRMENQIQKASNAPDNLIIDEPRVKSIVNYSDKFNTYLLFIAIGLLIPALFVTCKEFFFKFSIQTRDEVEKISNLPILGTIERSNKKEQVVVKYYPKSSFTECFRSLRSRVEYVAKKEKGISILITSTEPQDGKTFIATNLAGIYQFSEAKVIIVDFDLRRPALTKSMNVSREQKGVSNLLAGQVKLDDLIITHPEYGFDFVPAGIIPPNPSELIRSEETKDLLKELNERYDFVILDCSPVGLVSDAYFLARQVDLVLYVVRNEKTNRNFFKTTIKELREDAIDNIAIVYNDINIKSNYYGSRRYYGKNSYYNKHSSYYNNDDKE